MTRIGVINDPHSNVLAVKALLPALREAGCREIICTGDLIGVGPWPEETVRFLRDAPGLRCVLGNHDDYLVRGVSPAERAGMDEQGLEHHRWQNAQLSRESRDWLRALPFALELEREGLRLAALHYPRGRDGSFCSYPARPDAGYCDRVFAGVTADVVLFGHDHRFFDQAGRARYLNCGAAGCPERPDGLAQAGVLVVDRGRVELGRLTVPYDVEAAAAHIRRLRYPDYQRVLRVFYGVEA